MSVPPSPPAGGSYQPQGYQPYPPAPDGAYQPPAAYQPPGGGYPPPPGYQGYGQPPQPPKKGHAGLIAAIVAVVLALGGGGFAAYWFLGRDGDKVPSASQTKTSKKATKSTKTKTPTPTPSPTPTETETPEPEPEQAELGVWYECGIGGDLEVWVPEAGMLAVDEATKAWRDAGCGTITVVSKAASMQADDLQMAIDIGGAPDIVFGDPSSFRWWVSGGILAELDLSPVEGAIEPKAATAMGGYGLPLGSDVVALVRNNAILQDTPDTFQAMVEQAMAAGTPKALLIEVTEEVDPFLPYPIQSSFGATLLEVDDDGFIEGDLALGGEAGREFATYLGGLASQGALGVENYDDILQAFVDGEAPYLLAGSWQAARLNYAIVTGTDLTVLPVPPAGDYPAVSLTSAGGFGIIAATDQELAAQEFLLNFVAAPAVNEIDAQMVGYLPANLEARATLAGLPAYQGFIDAVETAQYYAPDTDLDVIFDELGYTLTGIITGNGIDPALAWDDMIESIAMMSDGSIVVDGGFDPEAFCAVFNGPEFNDVDVDDVEALTEVMDALRDAAPEELKSDIELIRDFTVAYMSLDEDDPEYYDKLGELVGDGEAWAAAERLEEAAAEMCG
jgi:arabinogalactan oligomer/maltooligosaccharide transport system substrate-binding protein